MIISILFQTSGYYGRKDIPILVKNYAIKKSLVDIPNERSSHIFYDIIHKIEAGGGHVKYRSDKKRDC